jgi:hypothetical protein
MTRLARMVISGLPHHVTQRGNRRESIFFEFSDQEDVKKLICWSFRDFIFGPKCLPTPQRSLIGHPRAIF